MDVRVLTLNAWGLKYLSKHREERMSYLGHLLSTSFQPSSPAPLRSSTDSSNAAQQSAYGYDVVCLQEIFVQADVEMLKRKARQGGLPYSRWFRSGVMGSGLLTLSRFPIITSSCIPYTLSGYPLAPLEGDWFGWKAIGKTVLDLGNGNHIAVFNTHTHYYPTDQGLWQESHRVAQMWQLSKLVHAAAASGQHVIVCGDLNSQPHSVMIRLLLSATGLKDSWKSYIESTPQDSSLMVDSEIKTCDSLSNTYSSGKSIPANIRAQGGKRIDYILVMPPLKVEHAALALNQPIPNLGQSISDHFGYACTFNFPPKHPPPPTATIIDATPQPPPPDSNNSVGYTSSNIPYVRPAPFKYLSKSTLTEALSILSLASKRNRQLRSLFIFLFFICLIVAVPVLAVGASFQPLSYLNWIFILLSVTLGVVGSTLLYVGVLWGYTERNLSNESIQEMQELLILLEMRDLHNKPIHPALNHGW